MRDSETSGDLWCLAASLGLPAVPQGPTCCPLRLLLHVGMDDGGAMAHIAPGTAIYNNRGRGKSEIAHGAISKALAQLEAEESKQYR